MSQTTVYFKYGSMNSGKSLELLKIAYNYEENGINPLIMKSKVDTRREGMVFSRIGLEKNAIEIDENTKIEEIIKNNQEVILIDEAQFLPVQTVDKIIDISYEKNVHAIMFFGLKVNIFGKLFPASQRIIERADKIEESTSICWCGKKARQNVRVVNGKIVKDGPVIWIEKDGEKVEYVTLCNYHAYKGELE